MTITKADLVQQIYNKHEKLTKGQATEAVEAFLRISTAWEYQVSQVS